MLIYFLRHGDASSDPNLQDIERPLTNLGVQQATLVGIFLQRINIHIDTIISSPLVRAQQTASIIQENINTQKPVISDLLLNGTDQQDILQYLDNLSFSSALLVGHIPHLERTISVIVNGKRENEIKMKKCSLAIVEASVPIRPGSGQLKQLTHIDEIAELIKS
jgi:phosphohistidine phosphatase